MWSETASLSGSKINHASGTSFSAPALEHSLNRMSPGNISGHTQRGGGWKYIPTGKVMDHGARQSIDPCSLDACFHLNVLLQQGHALTTSAESMGMNLPVGVGSYFSNSVREGCVSTAAWKHDYKWAQEIIDCGHLVRCSNSEVPVGAVNNLMLKPARRSSVARETGNVTYTEAAHSDCWYKQVWRATYPCHVSGLTTGKVLPKRHSRQLHIELYAATLSYFQYLPI